MPVIEKMLNGILRYNKASKANSLKKLIEINKNIQPKAVIFSCMDARVRPNRFLDDDLGDHFIVRNVGNMVPDASTLNQNTVSTEAGALEFGCIQKNVKDIVVCGHSDCKTVNMLYDTCIQQKEDEPSKSYLEMWLKLHGRDTIDIFKQLKPSNNYAGPLLFEIENYKSFEAYIDPENKFSITDKFSQVNCLQQLHHISTYPFLKLKLMTGQLFLHAFWFDVHSADVYMFSRARKQFIPVNQDNFEHLLIDSHEQIPK
ncbi:beta carbonic anhydrase 1 [Patella vulgata]|uniref:beta carbonic anhydrase 1 n=1 Tax=Patella vulgata TaxID=6465 RepID=UPI00217FC39E|nr:beta carbonic anhydrase 1 [Patella vulgata]